MLDINAASQWNTRSVHSRPVSWMTSQSERIGDLILAGLTVLQLTHPF
jgi:pyridoxine/pyridoxamine 5'-phosphate oxidase